MDTKDRFVGSGIRRPLQATAAHQQTAVPRKQRVEPVFWSIRHKHPRSQPPRFCGMSNDLSTEVHGRELGNRYAVHALRERRAEMAGELVQTTERLRYLKRAIENLDATLAIMSPGFDPATIRPKRVRRKAKLFGAGKLNQMILDVLRRGDRPMTIAEVTEGVGALAGFGPDATAGLRQRVRANLLYLVKVRGTLAKDGEGRGATWQLNS